MSKSRVLVVAPAIFPPANISAPMAEKVARVYNKKGNYEVDALYGILATRLPIIERLKKHPQLMIYMGHGQKNAICGDTPFCDGITTYDAHLFKGMIIVAAPTCEVGQVLAPTSIYKGAKAFVGATTSMYGAWNEPAEHNYYADWRNYFETLYKYLMTDTVGNALQAYKDKATEYIELYKSKESIWEKSDWYLNATYTNRDRLEVFGDANAKVEDMNSFSKQEVNETIEEILDWFAPPLL